MGIWLSLYSWAEARSDPKWLTERGFRLIDKKKWKEAEKVFLEVVEAEPGAVANNALGVIAEKMHRTTDAVVFYTRATTYKPFESIYWFNLGNALRATSVEAAVHAYEKALFLKNDNDDVLLNLGYLIKDEKMLRKVRHGRGLVSLARILEENNNDTRACGVYREARSQGYDVGFVLGLCDLRQGNDTELREYLGTRSDMDDRLAFFVGSTPQAIRRARKKEPEMVNAVRAMESQVALQVDWGAKCVEQRPRYLPIPLECQYNTVWVDSFESVKLPPTASALVVVGGGLGSSCALALRHDLPCIGVNVLCGVPRGLHDDTLCPPWNDALIPKRAVVLMTTYFWPQKLRQQAWKYLTRDALEVFAWQDDPLIPPINATSPCQPLFKARVSWNSSRVPMVVCRNFKVAEDLEASMCAPVSNEDMMSWLSSRICATFVIGYALFSLARWRQCRKTLIMVQATRLYCSVHKLVLFLLAGPQRRWRRLRLKARVIQKDDEITEKASQSSLDCAEVNHNQLWERIVVRNTFLHVMNSDSDEEFSKQAKTWPVSRESVPQVYPTEEKLR